MNTTRFWGTHSPSLMALVGQVLIIHNVGTIYHRMKELCAFVNSFSKLKELSAYSLDISAKIIAEIFIKVLYNIDKVDISILPYFC